MNELALKERTISSIEVAEKVGKEHHKLLRDIREYCNDFNESNFGLVDFFKEDTYLDKKGEERLCYQITKKGCELVANKLTGKKGIQFTASYVNKFNDMEKGKPQISYIEQLEGAKLIADDLRVSHASKVLMYHKVCEANGVATRFLPAYVEEKATKSLTELLKEHKAGISTRVFNQLLINEGLLENISRPSTKAGVKYFKSLTDKGLKFGMNMVNPKNSRETQPRYYINMFDELLSIVLN